MIGRQRRAAVAITARRIVARIRVRGPAEMIGIAVGVSRAEALSPVGELIREYEAAHSRIRKSQSRPCKSARTPAALSK
jgi:hypothetical protein